METIVIAQYQYCTILTTVHTLAKIAGGSGDFDDESQHASKHYYLQKTNCVRLNDPGYGDLY